MSNKKKTILNVGYGKIALVNEYYKGNMSSRHFYGSIELEKKGCYNILNISLDSNQGIKGIIHNNLMMLQRADVIFIPYLFVAPFVLLAVLKHLGLSHKKMIGICHTTMKKGNGLLSKMYYRMIYHSFDVVFFHSLKNMNESISDHSIKSSKARFLFWGDDLDYIDKTYPNPHQGDFFISTGREQRDYKSLIYAFEKIPAKLELYTNRTNESFCFLENQIGKSLNVKIEFVERNNVSANKLAKRTSECLCVLIPLNKEHVNYCLGLTSIVEAMAMGKPIICTYNPYSPIDIKKEGIGLVVDDNFNWSDAISYISTHRAEAMEMGKRGRALAEKLYNIKKCASQLEEVITTN